MSIVEAMRLPLEGLQRTFSEDEKLPPLPLPPLSLTLRRYLDSVRPFVSSSEFAKTEEIVCQFEKGVGQDLHEKLKAKAEMSQNWLERWWENKAYLENRLPLIPFCSMTGSSPLESIWKFSPGRMIKYTSLYMYYTIEMWALLRSELLIPTQSADGKTIFSMQQFRRLFNCCRIPLPERDRLDVHFKTAKEGQCSSYVIVTCNGHIFALDVYDKATGSFLNPPEWENQLQYIVNKAYECTGQGIASFTCDDRDTWAKNYKQLKLISGDNALNLEIIESAICLLILEPDLQPESASEVTMCSISGNYNNLWADKSLVIAFYGNGRSSGLADHTAFDGMISITNSFYTYQSIIETDGEWTGPASVRQLPVPRPLNFFLGPTLESELSDASLRQKISKTQVIIVREKFSDFGKNFPVKKRIHPDTFVQMALQLTYYIMHNKFAPCYETATTRAFYNGRTETLRSCTVEMTKWILAMMKDEIKAEEKVKLLRIAVKKHDELMKEARENAGCDRHLFGLYCIAEENQIPTPDLFQDESYSKSGGGGNFILSTSLVGYTPVGGGVAPMCINGYGVFYNICSDSFTFTVSVMRSSTETSAMKFFRNLCSSFQMMRHIIETAEESISLTPRAHL